MEYALPVAAAAIGCRRVRGPLVRGRGRGGRRALRRVHPLHVAPARGVVVRGLAAIARTGDGLHRQRAGRRRLRLPRRAAQPLRRRGCRHDGREWRGHDRFWLDHHPPHQRRPRLAGARDRRERRLLGGDCSGGVRPSLEPPGRHHAPALDGARPAGPPASSPPAGRSAGDLPPQHDGRRPRRTRRRPHRRGRPRRARRRLLPRHRQARAPRPLHRKLHRWRRRTPTTASPPRPAPPSSASTSPPAWSWPAATACPHLVRDFIPQHHGTRLVTYFYRQAVQDGGKVDAAAVPLRRPAPANAGGGHRHARRLLRGGRARAPGDRPARRSTSSSMASSPSGWPRASSTSAT